MSNTDSTKESVYPVKQTSDREYLVDDYETFWAEQASSLLWSKSFSTVKDISLWSK